MLWVATSLLLWPGANSIWNDMITNWANIILFLTSSLPDAKDLAGLLSVSGVTGEDHKESTHVWPSPEGSAHHPAPTHLALIPTLCQEPALAWDSHQSIPPLPQGQNNCCFKCYTFNFTVTYYTEIFLTNTAKMSVLYYWPWIKQVICNYKKTHFTQFTACMVIEVLTPQGVRVFKAKFQFSQWLVAWWHLIKQFYTVTGDELREGEMTKGHEMIKGWNGTWVCGFMVWMPSTTPPNYNFKGPVPLPLNLYFKTRVPTQGDRGGDSVPSSYPFSKSLWLTIE